MRFPPLNSIMNSLKDSNQLWISEHHNYQDFIIEQFQINVQQQWPRRVNVMPKHLDKFIVGNVDHVWKLSIF